MQIVIEYITQNYVTLMLSAGLAAILVANRGTKVYGSQYIWSILAIVFVLTVLESVENWCDAYDKSIIILYVKTTLVYFLYPLMALLELYLIVTIRRKFILAIPQIVNMVICIINLFKPGIVFGFHPDHHFYGGIFGKMPHIVLGFYVIMLAVFSLQFLKQDNKAKCLIVMFMAFSALATNIGQIYGFAKGHAETVALIDIMIYYFYLATIQQTRMQNALYQKELQLEKNKKELEQNKIRLLVAQIQPHFIYNSLMALQSKVVDNPIAYEGLRSFGEYLRSNFTAMTNNELIPFKDELKCIKAYLMLERINYGTKMTIKYDIEINHFMLPALCVEPLVENAVRYGIGTYDKGGTVEIIVRDEPEFIEIEVHDDGSGGNKLTDKQKRRKSIGLENVKMRLNASKMGTISITQDETGTRAVVRLIYVED